MSCGPAHTDLHLLGIGSRHAEGYAPVRMDARIRRAWNIQS